MCEEDYEVKFMKMKIYRLLLCCITVICLLLCSFFNNNFLTSVQAAAGFEIKYTGFSGKYTKSNVAFTVNGKDIDLGTTPGLLLSNNAMGSYVDVFKKGLRATCKYDSQTKKLTIEKFGNTVELTLNKKTAYVNGKKKTMEVPVRKVTFVSQDKTQIMVPVRFVCEKLGYKYTWNKSKQCGTITYDWLELKINSKWMKYEGTKVKSSYNGKNISYGDMPGIILGGISYVNARKVFEKTLGAEFSYDSESKQLTLKKDKKTVVYCLETNNVIVNGQTETVSSQALKVKNFITSSYYYMVPARHAANALGYQYDWDRASGTSKVSDVVVDPEKVPGAVVTQGAISFELPDGVDRDKITDTDVYYSNKFYLTFAGDYTEFYEKHSIQVSDPVIKDYKVTTISSGKTRITFYTTKLQGYRIEVNNGICNIVVGNPKDIYKNIVVLDCGHGGYDPGAQGGGYSEKNITYSILYTQAKKYFNSSTSSVKAYWSRHDDTFVSLSDRASFASKVGADLFISLHMNSATNTEASGTEVFYSSSNNKTLSNGLSSKIMANLFEESLVKLLETKKRGVKTANYTVIYSNTVPAVLIEFGFISNSSDRELMIDETVQKKAAKEIYNVTSSIFEKYPTGR